VSPSLPLPINGVGVAEGKHECTSVYRHEAAGRSLALVPGTFAGKKCTLATFAEKKILYFPETISPCSPLHAHRQHTHIQLAGSRIVILLYPAMYYWDKRDKRDTKNI
jgi:hypothetical protein